MAYIGTSPSNGVRRVHTYTATASQTTFTGAGAEGVTLSYKDSNFVDVYQNGIKLGDADYTATSGTSIVLAQGASVSDLVVIVVFDVFSVADTVSKADGGTFDGAVTFGGGVSGVLDADGGITVDNITIDGTEIDLSSGDLTLDVAGDIILDADGSDIFLKDGGTEFGRLSLASSGLQIYTAAEDADIYFKGNDGGSTVTALTLDMSVGGFATFANGIDVADGNISFAAGHGIDFSNASGSASGSASALLDDYEEGTWTPTLAGASSGTRALSSINADYTKIGRVVHLSLTCAVDGLTGANSGTAVLAGLPFNYNGSVAEVLGIVHFKHVNLPSGVVDNHAHSYSGGTSDQIFFSSTFDDSNHGELGISAFADDSELRVFITYLAA